MQTKPKPGRPPVENPKIFISIRLDQDVIMEFKATGKGWQTRINSVLKQWISEQLNPLENKS